MTLLDAFLQRAHLHPDRVAIIESGGRSITYRGLVDRSAQLASVWQKQGLTAGDRVLVAIWPSIALYAALAALWRLGAVAVLPEAATGLAGFRYAAAATRPGAILAGPSLRVLAKLLPETRRIPLCLSPRSQGSASSSPHHVVEATDPALISFTSGTTGRPKGMIRSHGLLLAQHEALAPIIAPTATSETDLVTFPAFVLTCLGHGTTAVLPAWNLRRHDRVSADFISWQAQKFGVTRLLVPPVITARLAREGVAASVRRVLTGGGPVYPDVARAFLNQNPGLGLTIVYGSTEAEPISCIDAETLSEADWQKAAQGGGLPVGYPVPQATVMIERDEILVAGPHVNRGYVDSAMDATTKVRIGDRVFHRTADAGRLDSDNRLWLLGRFAVTRPGIYPFAIETAARLQPGVKGAVLVTSNERAILFIEGSTDALAPDFAARLNELGIAPRTLAAIPLDKRHRSKPDYAALVKIAR